jgi:hypothetical protein
VAQGVDLDRKADLQPVAEAQPDHPVNSLSQSRLRAKLSSVMKNRLIPWA